MVSGLLADLTVKNAKKKAQVCKESLTTEPKEKKHREKTENF